MKDKHLFLLEDGTGPLFYNHLSTPPIYSDLPPGLPISGPSFLQFAFLLEPFMVTVLDQAGKESIATPALPKCGILHTNLQAASCPTPGSSYLHSVTFLLPSLTPTPGFNG